VYSYTHARTEGLSADQLDDLLTRRSGLLGVSETSADMRDLLAVQSTNMRAAEAVELFCYQTRKSIGALATALGDLDVILFNGGIGERAGEVRARICGGLATLGVRLDPVVNAADAPAISSADGTASVRVIPTDEEGMIAKTIVRLTADESQRFHGAPAPVRPAAGPSDELLAKMDAYWRPANYLCVGQIYLLDNPPLREPLTHEHIKKRLLGHWGITPGLNRICVHVNRAIRDHGLNVLSITGPGHGGPGIVANGYLEGTYTEVYPTVTQDEAGMRRLFKKFSFPGGIVSHRQIEVRRGVPRLYSVKWSFFILPKTPRGWRSSLCP